MLKNAAVEAQNQAVMKYCVEAHGSVWHLHHDNVVNIFLPTPHPGGLVAAKSAHAKGEGILKFG